MSGALLDLAQRSFPIDPDTPGALIYERFEAEPDTLAIAVVGADGAPVGLVERTAFFLAMAGQYGRALYAGRPISLLMNPEPLVVEGDVDVAAFCGEALAERPSELLRGFIVTQGGLYAGVGSALCLLQATNAANRAHADEMTTLAAAMDQARMEAQAALTAKSQFLAVMSHEIRTPLNGVLAIADILARKLAQPELIPYVRGIQDSGETLLRLLTDALDLSRADAGRLELNEDSFALARVTGDLATLWGARAELKGLTLAIVYDGPADQWALGDEIRIKQVFNNLIGNALKFTQTGGVEVTLRVRRDGVHLAVEGEVSDTGTGVPEDRLASIFQPFSQTESGLKQGGAGLGLSICRELVDQMGGTIGAARNAAGGLRLSFAIPLFDLPAPCGIALAQEAQRLEQGGLHILIADDNATNRLVAETLCDMFGATTESVEDGLQAVAAATERRFDLILMDIRMPNLDGVAATRAIRALPGVAGQVPILALTANADPWDAVSYMAQGMNGVVEKPIKPERLMVAINEALDTDRRAVAA